MNINVTRSGWNKMGEILRKSNNKMGFIYSCASGGCNGFNFKLDLLNQEKYNIINKNKFLTILYDNDNKLYIDPLSEMYLLGTTINYVKEDFNKGIFESKFIFEIDKNKMTSCGCGTSFSPKN